MWVLVSFIRSRGGNVAIRDPGLTGSALCPPKKPCIDEYAAACACADAGALVPLFGTVSVPDNIRRHDGHRSGDSSIKGGDDSESSTS